MNLPSIISCIYILFWVYSAFNYLFVVYYHYRKAPFNLSIIVWNYCLNILHIEHTPGDARKFRRRNMLWWCREDLNYSFLNARVGIEWFWGGSPRGWHFAAVQWCEHSPSLINPNPPTILHEWSKKCRKEGWRYFCMMSGCERNHYNIINL